MINLYIKERQLGEVTVLDLKGRVRVGGATVALHKSFRSLVQEDKLLIILNLADVSHIDSSGLGELISSHISVFNKGGEIKLVQLTETLRELMTATKLLTIFDVFENEEDALASFRDHAVSVKAPALAFA